MSDRIAAAHGLSPEAAQVVVKAVLEGVALEARECVAALVAVDPELGVGARAIVSRLLHAGGAWNRV